MYRDMLIVCCITIGFIYYILQPRTIRILIDPSDHTSFLTVTKILYAKRWLIFSSSYVNCFIRKGISLPYEETIVMDLNVPSLFESKIFNPLSKITTIDVLEAE